MRQDIKKLRGSVREQPVLTVVQNHLVRYPTPSNLNGNYNWGVQAGLCLVLQILTGIFLAMHYTAHVDQAFHSVQHQMRDVPNGWLLRYLHANGASLFFIVVYMHQFRALYYTSYASPREFVWLVGVVILQVMIQTAFIGYVQPWGLSNLAQYEQYFFSGTEYNPIKQCERLRGTFITNAKREKFAFYTPRIPAEKRYGPHESEIVDLIIGIMLSEGYLEEHGNGVRLTLHFGAKNINYLLYIHAILYSKGYCSDKTPIIKPMKKYKDKGQYFTIKLNTYTFGSFKPFRKEWYNADGVKVMPSNIRDMLNARVIRHMIMGDGNLTGKKAVYIATYAHTFTEVQLFVKALNFKFRGLNAQVRKHGSKYWKVYIPAKQGEQLHNIIRPYVNEVKCMKYKLPKVLLKPIIKYYSQSLFFYFYIFL